MRNMNWQEKLDIFLKDFEHINDLIGILVCGSYITGNPSSHSDLDVHFILNDSVDYRERGNKVVDGLLIEYFSNPPKQIIRYFEEDLGDKSLMSQVQFATGMIVKDTDGEVKKLKDAATKTIEEFYKDETINISDTVKYCLWDKLDDLQDAYENNRQDFDFIYYNLLNMLISDYMKIINRPYTFKTILGNINSQIVRDKYLLKTLPNDIISDLISKCILVQDRSEKMNLFQQLTNEIIDAFGGFDIDKYKFKSGLCI